MEPNDFDDDLPPDEEDEENEEEADVPDTVPASDLPALNVANIPVLSLTRIPMIDKTKPVRMVGDWLDTNDIPVTAPEDCDMNVNSTKYFDMVEPRLEEIVHWRKEGLTAAQVAHNLGVGVGTFSKYIGMFKELRLAMTFGKLKHRAEMVNTLHNAATGYTVTLKRRKLNRMGDVVEYDDTFYVQPNIEALKLVLQNEYKEVYGAKQTVTHEGELGIKAIMDAVTQKEQEERAKPLPPPEFS